ncbi:MAG TPA: DEAD/DEAH box helicase [Candidatus Cloacimonetes bacterium]|nr:DEAD/DEAH box helicase [Candidatus Cloacimonadota bacterium]HEX37747.1 DEAD/DEAH box helicase [Candidatus Cloacimonadota bacterium]
MAKAEKGYPSFDFIAVDTETTGLDATHNDIIEIGAVRFEHGQPVETFQTFVHINKPIPEEITVITHIKDKDLVNAPSIKMALEDFLEFIKDGALCFHNANFDLGFLNESLGKCNLPQLKNEYYDTVELSRIFLPHLKSHSLGAVAEYFNITNPQVHRAHHDAGTTGEIFVALTDFIIEHIEHNLVKQIEEIASFALKDAITLRFLKTILGYKTKMFLQHQKSKSPAVPFFTRPNFISNLVENEPPLNDFNEDKILSIFEEGGSLASNFEQYEHRDGQIDMAAWTIQAYQEGKHLLIEAGTGVGKSMAYLIPSIYYSKFADKRIIISTNTKNLQEQLFFKDIPTIQQTTELTFTAVLLKGRKNYLCLRKWYNVISDINGYLTPFEMKFLLHLIIWVATTKTGDIEENQSFKPYLSGLWSKIASDGTSCHGRGCPYNQDCFVMKIRKLAEDANLVIINHALLLSDAANEFSVLGNYNHLVIDEAHNLPNAAAIHFGFSITILDLLNITRKLLTKGEFQYGIINNLRVAITKSTLPDEKKNTYKSILEECEEPIDIIENQGKEFFQYLNQLIFTKGSYKKLRFQNFDVFRPMKVALEDVSNALSELNKKLQRLLAHLNDVSAQTFPKYDENMSDLDGIINQIVEVIVCLQHIFNPDFENFAFWLETSDNDYKNDYLPHSSIVCAPIEVNEHLYKYFWDKLETAILTSATLAIRDEFKFYKHLTGLDEVAQDHLMEYIASSPFNYPSQMKVLIPDYLPNPQDPLFPPQALSLIEEVLSVHKRGTLVLFTSYKDLDNAYSQLSQSAIKNKLTLLAQGKTGSRTTILEIFRNDENSVLLGTKSFWEGVDVQGKSLEILVLFRLPFLVPTEPLVEAYLDKLTAEGKNSFMHYTLPISLLHFKQGFGRLIRNKTDKGVVVILDARIFKKQYGRYFINVMPLQPNRVSSPFEITDHISNWFK